jgi:hypothetical protein
MRPKARRRSATTLASGVRIALGKRIRFSFFMWVLSLPRTRRAGSTHGIPPGWPPPRQAADPAGLAETLAALLQYWRHEVLPYAAAEVEAATLNAAHIALIRSV